MLIFLRLVRTTAHLVSDVAKLAKCSGLNLKAAEPVRSLSSLQLLGFL